MTELFESGIQTEDSDIRAHVSPCNKHVYVFRTRNAIEAIEQYEPEVRPAFQDGVKGKTAEGWLVKLDWIRDLRRLNFVSWPKWGDFSKKLSTSQKGALAVECVTALMKIGRFPLWLDAWEDDREYVQLKGTDVLLFAKKRIQIKCDYSAGDTGNLFLQRAERNPLKRF